MKKLILTFLVLAMFASSICAQERSVSVVVGVNPHLGSLSSKIKFDDEKHNIDYKSTFGVSVDVERQLRGYIIMTEFKYGKWELDEFDPYEGNSLFPIPDTADDLNTFTFMQYGGRTIFPNKRFQIPLYIGIGLDYLQGAPYHNLLFDLGAKARMKFYITDKVGIYGGVDLSWGIGSSGRGMEEDSKDSFTISATRSYIDFGITVNL